MHLTRTHRSSRSRRMSARPRASMFVDSFDSDIARHTAWTRADRVGEPSRHKATTDSRPRPELRARHPRVRIDQTRHRRSTVRTFALPETKFPSLRIPEPMALRASRSDDRRARHASLREQHMQAESLAKRSHFGRPIASAVIVTVDDGPTGARRGARSCRMESVVQPARRRVLQRRRRSARRRRRQRAAADARGR